MQDINMQGFQAQVIDRLARIETILETHSGASKSWQTTHQVADDKMAETIAKQSDRIRKLENFKLQALALVAAFGTLGGLVGPQASAWAKTYLKIG